MADVHSEHDGQPDQKRSAGVQEPEKGESEEERENRARQIDGAPADSIRKRAESRSREQADNGRDHHARQHRTSGQLQLAFAIAQDEDGEDIECPVLRKADPHAEQGVPAMMAHDIE